MYLYYDWNTVVNYLQYTVHYNEAIFVFIIMCIASTQPILQLSENCLLYIASFFGKNTITIHWLLILIITPILGSFITEPAAMTIAAGLLENNFYIFNPRKILKYATLGLLFVNISVGGTFTHFAAPPILLVSKNWNWNWSYILHNFAWKALIGIVISTFFYFLIFKKYFKEIDSQISHNSVILKSLVNDKKQKKSIPFWIYTTHCIFLIWTVVNLEYPVIFIGGFIFFLGFLQSTSEYQANFHMRNPLLVSCFLGGLVTHGNLQSWWIEPILSQLNEIPLFFIAVILTSFNDNAAITYLASLVPELTKTPTMQNAVVAGALTGGGLTVIANAPNPAGQSLLQKYFGKNGVSPKYLFISALIPTAFMVICFLFL